MTGIYKITNLINNKVYIGQSKDIEQRWKAHRCRYNCPNSKQYGSLIYTAMRKYGIDNFLFEVVEECKNEELNEKEIYYIELYDSYNNGYNLTIGGYNQHNLKLTDEQILEIQNLLMNSGLSQNEIAKQFNVSQKMISVINLGQGHNNSLFNYPLRKTKKEIKKRVNGFTEAQIEAHLKSRIAERPSRIKLKSLIRLKSFSEIGRLYNVSDNAIRKWCDTYKLPRTKKEISKYNDNDWEKL